MHRAVPIKCLSTARYEEVRKAFHFLGEGALNVIIPWASLGPIWTEREVPFEVVGKVPQKVPCWGQWVGFWQMGLWMPNQIQKLENPSSV